MGYYDHWVTTFVMNLSVIYDIEKLSCASPYVVEPEDPTFAEGIKIDDDAIFVQDDPFCDDPDIEEFSGYMRTRSHDLEREVPHHHPETSGRYNGGRSLESL